jgi:hypothetical protein
MKKKLQAPTSKFQTSSKSQAPKEQVSSEFEVWCFPGAWMLVLGAF